MGNSPLHVAMKEPRTAALAEEMTAFDNLQVHEIEAYWRAFYDYATSFALTRGQFRTICCSAARALQPQASTSRAAADADRAFGLFTRSSANTQGYGRAASDPDDVVIDALEFYSSMAFVAAVPLDDKVDLLFDSWDMSEDGELDLDEFTISLKSTLSGLAKILRLRTLTQPDTFAKPTGLPGMLDEDEIIVLAGVTFRDIRNAGATASSTQQDGQESINCEQFRQYCTTNQRTRSLFALFDLISAQPVDGGVFEADPGEPDTVDSGEWGRERQTKADQLQTPSAVESLVKISSVSDIGDEFLAVKPWKGAIVPPTKVPALSSAAPAISLRLDWIHGYSAQENSRNNLHYISTTKSCVSGRPDEIIYPAAAVCVVLNTKTMVQRHLLTHTDDILSLCVHPTLPVAASGEIGKQPKIVVWDIESTEPTCVLKGFHQRGVLLLGFVSVDTLVSVGGDEDHSIAIYESKDSWRSAALKITSKGNKAVPFSLAAPCVPMNNAAKQFVISGQKFVELWAIKGSTLTSKKGLLGQKGTQQPFVAAECIAKGNNGPSAAVVGTTDGKLYLFSGRELSAAVSAHKGAVTALFYSGGVLLSGGKDGQIILWDDNLKQVGGPFAINDVVASTTGARHYLSIRSCCLSPDKRTILVGTEASEIYELDAKTGKSCRSESPLVKGHFVGELWGLAVHPTKPQFCTVGDDQTLRIWDLVSQRELRSTNLESSARACVYSPDGKMIAVGFGGAEASQSTATGAKSTASRGRGGRGRGGTARGAPPQGGFVVYTEAELVKVKEPCYDPKKWVSDVKFSPDGRYLAVASHDCKLYVYDVLNGFARRHVFKKHSSYIAHVDFSSDGNYLQSMCGAYELLFSEVQSGRHVTSAATFRDERWHTMTSTLGWSVQGIWEPESDGTDVNAVDRSRDGKFLITGDDFGKVKLFQYPCALEKASSVELRGHASHVTNVRWAVDDAFVVSVGGNDRCVFVWKHDKQQPAVTGNSIEISDQSGGVAAGNSRRRKSSVALVELQPTINEQAGEPELGSIFENRIEKPAAGLLEEGPEGDEFMAVKPWLGTIVPPTNSKVLLKGGSSAPDAQLALEYIHGYQSQNASNNARYDASGRVVYHAAAVGIVADKQQQQHAPCQRFFQGHDDDVVALCAHPNGSTFATAQMGKCPKIFVWNSEDGTASAPCIEGFHQRFVSAICFSFDGSKLGSVGGDDDHSVVIYSWEKNLLIASAKGERHAVKSICYHASTQEWVTCGERHVRFWKEQGKNLTSKRAIFGKAAEQKLASVFECVLSFGPAAVAGGSDGNLYVFQGSNELSQTVSAHGSTSVFALAVSPDSGAANELVSGGKDGKIAIWNTQFVKVAAIDLSEVASTTSPSVGLLNAAVRSVHVSRRSARLFLVGTMGSDLIEIDAVSNSKPTMRFITRGHYHMELWGLACHPTKPEYCTVGDDQTIRIWCSEKRVQLRITRLRAAARACAISPSGKLVALGYGGRAQHQAKKSTATKSDGGRAIDCTGVVEMLDYNDLSKSVFHDKPSKQTIGEIKFSPNGETLAVGSHDHCIYIYRVERKSSTWSVRKTAVFNKHQSYITHLDFSSDGEFLQSNCGAYELLFSRTDSGKHITSASSVKDVNWATWTCVLGWPVQGIWPPYSDGTDVNAVARCSKGELLAAADDFGCVKLFRYPCVVKNAASNEYRSHSSHVTNVRWCVNDTKLISVGGLDRCIMQWNVLRSDRRVSTVKVGQAYGSDLEVTDLDSLVNSTDAPGYDKELGRNGTDDPYYDPGEGDEFMAVKPWVGTIVAPSNAPVTNAREPDVRVDLEWVYGYQSSLTRQNVAYNQHNEVVYHTAAVGVIYDASSHFQKHHIGHNDDITSFAIGGPQRSLIATGERGKAPVIRIWDAHTGELRSELKAGALASQSRAILSLAFSFDSTRLVSVGADDNHSVALWEDASQGGTWAAPRLVATVKGDRGVNMFTVFGSTRDAIVTGGVKHVLFWTVQGKNSMTAKKGQVGKAGTLQQFSTGCVFAATAGGNDDTFVTGTATGELYVWKGNQLSKTVKAHEGEVRVVVSTSSFVDSRGQRASILLSGGKDGRIVVWTNSFQSIRSFSLADASGLNGGSNFACLNPAINSLCLREDGAMLLVGTCSSDILELPVTPTSSGSFDSSPPSLVVSGHFSLELWGLAVHPLRRQFVTTGDDATMRVWDMDAKRIVSLTRLPSKARACAFSGDGEILAVGFGGDNGGVGRRRQATAQSGKVQPAKQSFEGAFSLFTTREVISGRSSPLFEDKPAKEWISDVKFSPNDALIALGSHDNVIYLYSLDKRFDGVNSQSVPRVSVTKRKPFAKHNSYITHLDFSADGEHVQSNCGAYEYLFCDTSTSEQVRSVSSLKNTQWATWTCVLGWPVQGIWPACADDTDVNAVCASQSRTLLASGDDAGLLKIFRFPCVLKGSQFVACRGHSSHVTNVRFSHDDKYVISVGGNDRSIFQWKLS